MGQNDEFCKTLSDDTLAISDEGLRVCALCDKVRVSHVQPCAYCIAADRKRAVLFSVYVMLLVVVAFGLSVTVSAYDSRVAEETAVVQWGDRFTETECAICPECCGQDTEEDASLTGDIDP